MTRIVLDTSFLAHALLPSQQTSDSMEALAQALERRDERLIPAHVAVEFGSLLRKSTTRRDLLMEEAGRTFEAFLNIGTVVRDSEQALREGYELANRLGHSDTFDATGYALAELLDAEFWCCDKRFANAAEALGLERVRLFR